jgi:starvation-inducible outer membrane lipoprotein
MRMLTSAVRKISRLKVRTLLISALELYMAAVISIPSGITSNPASSETLIKPQRQNTNTLQEKQKQRGE